jgi:protein glucosyltransferase
MMDSMERRAADSDPCTLPPPFTTAQAKEMADKEEELLRNIQKREKAHAARP